MVSPLHFNTFLIFSNTKSKFLLSFYLLKVPNFLSVMLCSTKSLKCFSVYVYLGSSSFNFFELKSFHQKGGRDKQSFIPDPFNLSKAPLVFYKQKVTLVQHSSHKISVVLLNFTKYPHISPHDPILIPKILHVKQMFYLIFHEPFK